MIVRVEWTNVNLSGTAIIVDIITVSSKCLRRFFRLKQMLEAVFCIGNKALQKTLRGDRTAAAVGIAPQPGFFISKIILYHWRNEK